MEPPPESPEWLKVVTAAERPDLWESVRRQHLFDVVWPAHANYQTLFIDERTGQVVARGRAIPFRWDCTLEDLPAGIDAVGTRAVTDPTPASALSALAAEVDPAYQGSGLSALLLTSMRAVARHHGLAPLLAPVRPRWKDRYPLTPIERFSEWRRDDGLLFDPWLRTHERLGARILRCEPRSLEITAPVADWERWTGLSLPETGKYVFPGGLAPLDVSDGTGTYFEPQRMDDPSGVMARGPVERPLSLREVQQSHAWLSCTKPCLTGDVSTCSSSPARRSCAIRRPSRLFRSGAYLVPL
jgi:GNAT superfamily N-acetyltransferase